MIIELHRNIDYFFKLTNDSFYVPKERFPIKTVYDTHKTKDQKNFKKFVGHTQEYVLLWAKKPMALETRFFKIIKNMESVKYYL